MVGLSQLYDEHAQALYAFLLNLTRNEAETKDALQEVFRKLAATPGLGTDIRDARAFLLRLARNAAIDAMRRRASRDKRHEGLAGETADLFAPAPDPDAAMFRQKLAEALLALPQEQREVVHLKLWEGLTFESIAETLEIPMNTAASRYRYGIDKLRERLRPLYEEIR